MTISSFGHLFGDPPEADLVIDCRPIRNPHYVPGLRDKCGLDEVVQKYVLSDPIAEAVLDQLQLVLKNRAGDRRPAFHVALGCAGGGHRSVAIAEVLADRIRCEDCYDPIEVKHLDLWRHT